MHKAKHQKLLANAEANQRASYFLTNHVTRSDDPHVAQAAKELANILQRKANNYRKKANELE